MSTMFIKPAPGKRCKDPKTMELVPERGRNVPRNGYWIRRLKDGDCVLAEKDVAHEPRKKKNANKKKQRSFQNHEPVAKEDNNGDHI